jgi:hypothetical protein
MADLGAPGSIDAPGDYDGDGRDELAAFDRVLGDWRIRPLGSSSTMETSFGPRGPRVIPVLSSINDRLETDEESDELDAPAVDEALGSLGRVLAGRN